MVSIQILTLKDDLNIDNATRKPWVSLARKHQVKVQAFYFTTPVDLCLHNDSFRALAGLEVAQLRLSISWVIYLLIPIVQPQTEAYLPQSTLLRSGFSVGEAKGG